MTIDLDTASKGSFQYVPVPNEHVPAVIDFLAQQMAVPGTPASSSASPSLDDDDTDASWTDAQLSRLLGMGTETSERLKRVLAHLAEHPGQDQAMSTREIATALDMTYHQMKNHPTQVKRTLGKHFPGHPTPWSAASGPQLSPPRADELHYWLAPARAAQVKRLLG